MHLDFYIVVGSAIVGLLVGLTGAGGGALMTPMLILLFGITPSSAISSDLVAAVLMRPFGAGVHIRKGTVNFKMVGWMVLGSVPMAFLGSYLLHLLGSGAEEDQTHVELALGIALLIGATAMIVRYVLDRRAGHERTGMIADIAVRPLPTVLIGAVGGLIVGMTSVGSGSLMIVLLLFVYPQIGANQLVGTDLTQAVPLTAAAALGALIWGSPVFGVTASIAIGAVPAVLIGSFLSSRAPRQVHQAGDHVRDLRVRAEVRRRADHGAGDRARLGARCRPGVLPRSRSAVEPPSRCRRRFGCRGRQRLGADGGHRERLGATCRRGHRQ